MLILWVFFLFFNWSIVALQYCACLCCTEKWLSYIHIHLLFQYSFPLWFIPGDWIQFPVLYSRTLAFIHSPCNSLSLFLLSFFLLNSWVANESFESMGACSLSQSCLTLCDPMNPLVLCPWYFPAKNTGVGCCFLMSDKHRKRQSGEWAWEGEKAKERSLEISTALGNKEIKRTR